MIESGFSETSQSRDRLNIVARKFGMLGRKLEKSHQRLRSKNRNGEEERLRFFTGFLREAHWLSSRNAIPQQLTIDVSRAFTLRHRCSNGRPIGELPVFL